MSYDVAGQLDRGRPAVADTQTYVTACHAVGYAHPDLTAHPAQVLEWYGTEDGLDLDALDADCVALRTMADAANQALRLERAGLRSMESAWQGESHSAAASFIDSHCQAGEAVLGALRAAADACAALRDTVLGLVDDKVRAATAIDDRRAGERPAWLAAAQVLTTGAAGRDQAAEIVVHQITPYVDTDIRTEWVTAMRAVTAHAQSAYLDAIGRVTACGTEHFAVPGRLGPVFVRSGPPLAGPAASVATPAAAPAEVAPPPAPPPSPAVEVPLAPPVPAAQDAMPTAQPAVPQSLPPAATMDPAGLGGAVPAAGLPALSGLGGLGDALGNLLPDGTDTAAAPRLPEAASDLEDPADDSPEDPALQDDSPGETSDQRDDAEQDDTGTEDAPEDTPTGDRETEDTEDTQTPDPATGDPVAEQPEPPVEVSPTPDPQAPPADKPTPCEIAADELPQVGQ